MADFVPTHRLTHEASMKMIYAGVAKANELGCKVSLAVVDQSCRLIAFLMMDGARHFSIITTQRKAITAASQRLPTGYAPEENALSMSVRMGDFTNVPGGFPIEVNGEAIGAVLRPREREDVLDVAALDELEEEQRLQVLRHRVDGLRDADRGRRGPLEVDREGLLQHLTRQAHDRRRHRG